MTPKEERMNESIEEKDLGFWRDLWQQARLAWRLLRDPAVPFYLKLLPVVAAGYVIFPFDFVPDLWPVLGQLDDVTALLVGLKVFVEMSPQDVVARHLDAIQREDGLPPKDSGKTIYIDPEEFK